MASAYERRVRTKSESKIRVSKIRKRIQSKFRIKIRVGGPHYGATLTSLAAPCLRPGRNYPQQILDHPVRVDPFGFRMKGCHDPVAEYRRGHVPHVVDRGVYPALQERPRLGTQDERLPRPRTRPPRHELAHEVGRLGLARPRRTRQVASILKHVFGHWHAANERLGRHDLLGGECYLRRPSPLAGRLAKDL